MAQISFFEEDVVYRLRNKRLLKHWLVQVIHEEGKLPGAVSVVLCSDEHLLAMNRQYLSHDYYTDIITFDYSSGAEVSGDLFISLDRVRENANVQQIPTYNELCRVIVHGVLHLLGYQDKTDSEKKIMRDLEDHYLRRFDAFKEPSRSN